MQQTADLPDTSPKTVADLQSSPTVSRRSTRLRERFFRSRFGRAAIALGTSALTATAAIAVEAAPAHAYTTMTYQVSGTEGEGPYIHPDAPTLGSTTGGLIPENGSVTISCWTVGDNVLGDAVWDYGTDARGRTGYLADYYINTPYIKNRTTSGLLGIIPMCGDEGQSAGFSSEQAPSDSTTTPSTPSSPAAPSTPDYEGSCAINTGQVAIESWNSALEEFNEDGELKSELERWDALWGNPEADDICVGARFSAPDPAHNNGEYISSVTSVAPDLDPAGCTGAMLIEVWGNGFYDKTDCSTPTEWHPDRWLKAGSWVCAAISSAYDLKGYGGGSDAQAVADVKSGRVKLGAADPLRTVTCTEVK